ncbi:hypothetical protein Scep_024942 [Stephania cephalantha]|uniref:Uncharacterized protein n=1 Tax=Stephania cephalantha TaxID=152367 RepID=A0AAP0F0D0_9MAGN
MTVLRSREVIPNSKSPKNPRNPKMSAQIDQRSLSQIPSTPSFQSRSQPKTLKKSPELDPNQRDSASPLRRSSRLKSRVSGADDGGGCGGEERGSESGSGRGGGRKRKARVSLGGCDSAEMKGIGEVGFCGERVERGFDLNVVEVIDEGSSGDGSVNGRKRKSRDFSGSGSEGEGGSEKKSDVGEAGNVEVVIVDSDVDDDDDDDDDVEKGKSVVNVVSRDFISNFGSSSSNGNGVDEDIMGDDSGEADRENDLASGMRRYSREEKGKGTMVEESERLVGVGRLDLNSIPGDGDAEVAAVGLLSMEQRVLEDVKKKRAIMMARGKANGVKQMKERFYRAARDRAEVLARGHESAFGSWQTLLDKERAQESNNIFYRYKPAIKIEWTPSNDKRRTGLAPSLLDLSVSALAKYAESISSLEGIPDILRNRLCYLLCKSRRMDDHFMELLVSGLPTEVRLKDCSWMTEEQMTKILHGCNFNQLSVLQLDNCGRCLPDYIVRSTLAKSKNTMPSLVSISLRGACRLTDNGLIALISSAPQLRSINLGQCSLLTSSGIHDVLMSVGSSLRELYLDDCQNIDAMLILPALMELQYLEVLSLRGINTVCDDFVKQLLYARGPTIKELVLANCRDLTDSAIGAITAVCWGLRSLDIVNVQGLTDVTLGHLIYGCKSIQELKLGCNSFSDEAIAAFIEASGESLVELSLNKLKQVGPSTAISISRCCSRNLQILDLSWCRNLADGAVGLIVDNCLSLRLLKLFGCTQITSKFVNGHSNPYVHIVGLKTTPILEHLSVADRHFGPLRYSAVPSCTETES